MEVYDFEDHLDGIEIPITVIVRGYGNEPCSMGSIAQTEIITVEQSSSHNDFRHAF